MPSQAQSVGQAVRSLDRRTLRLQALRNIERHQRLVVDHKIKHPVRSVTGVGPRGRCRTWPTNDGSAVADGKVRAVGAGHKRLAVDDGDLTSLMRNQADALKLLQCHRYTRAPYTKHGGEKFVRKH